MYYWENKECDSNLEYVRWMVSKIQKYVDGNNLHIINDRTISDLVVECYRDKIKYQDYQVELSSNKMSGKRGGIFFVGFFNPYVEDRLNVINAYEELLFKCSDFITEKRSNKLDEILYV